MIQIQFTYCESATENSWLTAKGIDCDWHDWYAFDVAGIFKTDSAQRSSNKCKKYLPKNFS